MTLLVILFIAPLFMSALIVLYLLRSIAGLDADFQPTWPIRS